MFRVDDLMHHQQAEASELVTRISVVIRLPPFRLVAPRNLIRGLFSGACDTVGDLARAVDRIWMDQGSRAAVQRCVLHADGCREGTEWSEVSRRLLRQL